MEMGKDMSEVCYRCGSEEELSVRARRVKNGVVTSQTLMCRSCRRDYAKNHKVSKPKIDWSQDWKSLAREINGRIIAKYGKTENILG